MAIKQIVCSGTPYEIVCSGTPYEIGYTHGQGAQAEIQRGITFYSGLFMISSNLSWQDVQDSAREFNDIISVKWPRYYQELQGVADGAERNILDIIALNVRSELVFGRFSDGCTSLYCGDREYAYLGQNWDWKPDQQANLIQLTIIQDLASIHMVTEAGIIGKIGFNSAGVGVCFNAIRARGLDKNRMPSHLGLRLALESPSVEAAVNSLEEIGMASSAHILIGDGTTAIGLEFTSTTFARLTLSDEGPGFVAHTNHMLLHHPNIYEPTWLKDSPVRLKTMESNIAQATDMSWATFSGLFEDETNYPCAINRAAKDAGDSATLFNIVMDLKEKKAVVKIGRPVRGDNSVQQVNLAF